MFGGDNKCSKFVFPMEDDGMALRRAELLSLPLTMRSPPDPKVRMREIKILEVLRVSLEVS